MRCLLDCNIHQNIGDQFFWDFHFACIYSLVCGLWLVKVWGWWLLALVCSNVGSCFHTLLRKWSCSWGFGAIAHNLNDLIDLSLKSLENSCFFLHKESFHFWHFVMFKECLSGVKRPILVIRMIWLWPTSQPYGQVDSSWMSNALIKVECLPFISLKLGVSTPLKTPLISYHIESGMRLPSKTIGFLRDFKDTNLTQKSKVSHVVTTLWFDCVDHWPPTKI